MVTKMPQESCEGVLEGPPGQYTALEMTVAPRAPAKHLRAGNAM